MRRAMCVIVFAVLALCGPSDEAAAISPQNPYRSFNLSGVNYGSMQWERAQREGRRVWPYFNTPAAATRAAPAVTVGGAGGVVRSAAPVQRRGFRRWRR